MGNDKLLISNEKVEVIPHGVVINYKKNCKSPNSISLGCLPRFEKRKGLNKLIEIMPKVLKYNKEIKIIYRRK